MENYKAKYLKYKNKYLLNKYNQMSGGGDSQEEIILFKAEWCGHCKSFAPTWQKLSEDNNLKNKVKFVMYDSEDKDKLKEYGIEGFPTIFYKSGDKNIEYVGNRDEGSIREFILSYSK